MTVLMFKDRFAGLIRPGFKLQTIRPTRKRPISPGDRLSLRRWTGKAYRSKQELLAVTVCISNAPVRIEWDRMTYDGRAITRRQNLDQLARLDGFENWSEMIDWFENTHGLPFEGTLIRWMKP